MPNKLQLVLHDEGTLLITLSGDWTLADGVPSPDEVLSRIGARSGIRGLAFDSAEIE